MKKQMIIYSAFVVLLAVLVGCQKETTAGGEITPEKDGTILAEVLPMRQVSDTKSTWIIDNDIANFEWRTGDQFLMIVKAGSENTNNTDEGTLNHNRFTAQGDGASVQFSGSLPDGKNWIETGYAITVKNAAGAGSNNDWGYGYESGNINDGIKLALRGTRYNQNNVDPLTAIPMVGVKQGNSNKYVFHAATGVFKFTVKNWPTNAKHLYLSVPSPATLQGSYPLDEKGFARMENGGSASYREMYIDYSTEAAGTTVDFYFPIPIGSIPANSLLAILDNGYQILYQQKFATAIESEENTLCVIAPITYRTVSDLFGTYSTTVTSGPYSTNAAVGDFVLAESDDSSKGNIMITKFAGIDGCVYGTFNPVTSELVFSKDQLFADNPYGQQGYDKIALVSHDGSSAVDVKFKVTPSGKVKFTGASLGFRATTEETWLNSYGGAWPWSLCYGSFVATKKQ